MDMYSEPPMIPPIPQSMGMGNMPYSNDNSTIASLRWNGDALIFQLYKLLGDYDIEILEDGSQIFKRRKINGVEVKPKINDEGLNAIISMVQANVNPYVSLSKIRDDEANTLIYQILCHIAKELSINKKNWDVSIENMSFIMLILKPIIFAQIKRPVDGWEGTNFKTNAFEQNVRQDFTQNNPQGGFSFWKPFGSNKQR